MTTLDTLDMPCDVRLKVTALLFRLRTPHSICLKEEYAAVVR